VRNHTLKNKDHPSQRSTVKLHRPLDRVTAKFCRLVCAGRATRWPSPRTASCYYVVTVVDHYRTVRCGVQKKSREESSGSGSGVEILVNEPYTDGPGGSGQYTQKIYHIGSHLPGMSPLLASRLHGGIEPTAGWVINSDKW